MSSQDLKLLEIRHKCPKGLTKKALEENCQLTKWSRRDQWICTCFSSSPHPKQVCFCPLHFKTAAVGWHFQGLKSLIKGLKSQARTLLPGLHICSMNAESYRDKKEIAKMGQKNSLIFFGIKVKTSGCHLVIVNPYSYSLISDLYATFLWPTLHFWHWKY